jgi:putative glutamine amidotransferase
MSELRPVIAISTALAPARWGVWDRPAALLAMAYITAIQHAGGLAVMLPPDPNLEDANVILDRVDGLILAGGSDIDPAFYGAEPHPLTDGPVSDRDRFEIELVRAAVQRDMPVLGICRGMQLLNVAFGGTLLQHVPEEFGHEEHRRVLGSFDGADHEVRLTPGSLAASAASETTHRTLSHHHQGVARIGTGLEVTGYSTLDDLPEALEAPDRRFVLGVQWHPEADEQSTVIAALVEQARAYRDAAVHAG